MNKWLCMLCAVALVAGGSLVLAEEKADKQAQKKAVS